MRLVACLAITLVLAGCASVPRLPEAMDWAERRATLQALSAWRMSGRVAVAVGGEGASAGLEWTEAGGVSDVRLSGPFGAGALRVTLGPQGMRVEDGRGAWVEGEQAEQLLADRLGTDVPLAALRYWVLGTPAPGLPFSETTGVGGMPRVFEQAGWQVSVDRWQAVSGNLLPARMTAEQGEARIKLAVSRWDLAP